LHAHPCQLEGQSRPVAAPACARSRLAAGARIPARRAKIRGKGLWWRLVCVLRKVYKLEWASFRLGRGKCGGGGHGTKTERTEAPPSCSARFCKKGENEGHGPTGARTGGQVALAAFAQGTWCGRTTAHGQRPAAGRRPRLWARRTTPWVMRRLHGACGSITGRTRRPYTGASGWRRVATRPGAVPRSGARGHECWRKAPVFISFGPFQNL
jgi:hypothetical protein